MSCFRLMKQNRHSVVIQKKTMGIRRVPCKNNRVDLEMKILRYRKIATDPDTAERIKQLIADLKRELREINE